jgi:hypothetical protein
MVFIRESDEFYLFAQSNMLRDSFRGRTTYLSHTSRGTKKQVKKEKQPWLSLQY